MTTTPQPHGTPDAPKLSVRGEGRLEVEPEIARLHITITARGTDRRTALDALTHRNTQLLDLIRSYGDTIEKTETGSLSITPELTRHGRGERVHAYHGRVAITLELSDFTTLGELTTRLADQELTQVEGPWWSLRPQSPVHALARRRAVHEALQRAHEYADALGTRVVALLELADTGTTGHNPAPGGFASAGARFAMSGPDPQNGDAGPIDLEPVCQTVHAQVDAIFTLAPPEL
ncbi:SIMPL domain-containing protein [Streptomyces sp. DT24]|uniref:SIMPL domain-containing protein n=1 Tax=Streptomyces sp. DT24 TaxID=3416520 RepID=UPI003CF35762